ncbi:cyclin-G1 isoform X2 [Hypanus sabinus]|nr:cyclin-G1 isoform X2 [Hypanus sabinus]XP_059846549.1 cyclin-G1 isoform X2 [Hypanus sabinus]XP_059846550.1 cyclin-G1 isoform X2 [Hypanus sabinus]XP_059846551.1 cyclin-G1 isoform X2 [Hypanus sabinus]
MIGTKPEEANEEVVALVNQLTAQLEQEPKYQPRISGLKAIESAQENGIRMTVHLRNLEVKDLLSLSQFFGFSTDTFVLAVSLLDRFLGLMKVQPKHLCCVGLCCMYLAVKATEEERIIPHASDLIRISQYRFTVSDMMRMENIILEKLHWRVKGPTALNFLRLYHKFIQNCSVSERKEMLNLDRLESQLKACSCHFIFCKTKGSILALSVLALEVQTQKLLDVLETIESLQLHSKISDLDLFYWRELVAKCLAEYSSSTCSRPNNKKLMWIVSRRTSRQLQSYHRVNPLPTIPEVTTSTE